jgi:hypothetical protein
MKKTTKFSSAQTRVEEIYQKGKKDLNDFYKRNGEWEGKKKKSEKKIQKVTKHKPTVIRKHGK